MGAGMASSASGFAALALAVVDCLQRSVSPEESSALARQSGSGSAARSVMGGYVEWPAAGSQGETAIQIFPAEQPARACFQRLVSTIHDNTVLSWHIG